MPAPYPYPPDFETKRLSLRAWAYELRAPETRVRLEAGLAGLLSPAVLAPLPPSLALGPGGVSGWIDARRAESQVYSVRLRGPVPELVGLLILIAPEDRALYLGYLLGEAFWGAGYATEMLAGLVDTLRAQSPLQLLAGVAPDNPGSIRVLEKAGFGQVGETETGAMLRYERRV